MNIYTHPQGLSSNKGDDPKRPTDLQTALNLPLPDGSTIYRQGGTYPGNYVVGQNADVTIKDAPGEHSVIDSNQNITLASDIPASGQGTLKLSGGRFVSPASVMIDTEMIRVVRSASDYNVYDINSRAWGGTDSQPHKTGAKVRVTDDIVVGQGANWTWEEGEITCSQTERILDNPGSGAPNFNHRGTGFANFAPNSKITDALIHNTALGVFGSKLAAGSEVYGCIIFNNGEEAPDRPHGYSIYTQNETAERFYSDNIVFGGFGGFAFHAYGTSAAALRGFRLLGNLALNGRFMVGGDCPADDILLQQNYSFDGFELGYDNIDNLATTLLDNIGGGETPFTIRYFKAIQFLRNRGVQNGSSQGASLVVALPQDKNINYQFDQNGYVFRRTPFDQPIVYGSKGYFFPDWQKLGFDARSTFSMELPTGLEIIYRPNKYKQGRCHIQILNNSSLPKFDIDLTKTGLTTGQAFEIRNGANFNAPAIYADLYAGQKVSIDVSKLPIAQPTGNASFRNPEISPKVCVLVVVPIVAQTPIPTPAPVPNPQSSVVVTQTKATKNTLTETFTLPNGASVPVGYLDNNEFKKVADLGIGKSVTFKGGKKK